MTVRAIEWAYRQDGIRSSDKFVLVTLADNANDDGRAWPATSTIARKTGQDRKTVVAALDRLESAGWIKDTGERVGGTRQIKIYRLRWPSEQHKDYQKREAVDSGKTNENGSVEGSQIRQPLTPDSLTKMEGLKTPKFAAKDSQICAKDSQIRDTEPSGTVRGTEPSAVSLSGDSQLEELVTDFETAKRLICKLILGGKNPAQPWSYNANEALTRQLPIPLIDIARVSWFRNLPEDPDDRDLCLRRLVTETGLCRYWSDEVTRANAYWQKVHGPDEVKKKEPPRWREFFVWKNGERVVLPDSFWKLDLCYQEEYRRDFATFVKAKIV